MERTSLKKLRKETGISQEEAAARAGINRSFYSFIEKGERNPSLDNAIRIAEVFEKDVSVVFPGEIFFAGRCYKEEQIETNIIKTSA